MFDETQNKAKILCFAAVLAVLAATLWPFNPFPRNGVTWLEAAGLKFNTDSLVVSAAPLTAPESISDSYTLELYVRPSTVRGSHTILGFYCPDRPSQLLVRQYFDGLLLTHDARIEHDPTRTIKFDVDHVFSRNKLVQIAISSGHTGTVVYVDGKLAERIPTFRISRDELFGEIVIGTSPITYHTWTGEMNGLAIYRRELRPVDALQHYKNSIDANGNVDLIDALASYRFNEGAGNVVRNEVGSGPNLQIPGTFSIPHKQFLRSPASEFRFDSNYAADLISNIVGFVPLGIIVCAYLLWSQPNARAIMLTTIACGSLSLLIEILQFYVPRRGSGITDVLTNTLGAAIGALLLQVGLIRRFFAESGLTPRD